MGTEYSNPGNMDNNIYGYYKGFQWIIYYFYLLQWPILVNIYTFLFWIEYKLKFNKLLKWTNIATKIKNTPIIIGMMIEVENIQEVAIEIIVDMKKATKIDAVVVMIDM